MDLGQKDRHQVCWCLVLFHPVPQSVVNGGELWLQDALNQGFKVITAILGRSLVLLFAHSKHIYEPVVLPKTDR
jgi:hypothetical protein